VYNWFGGAFLFGGFGLTLYTQMLGAFPGTNLYLGIVLAGIGSIPMMLTIAMLATAMPRTGGDYVWTSRVIHPAIGAASVVGGTVIWSMCFGAWNGYDMAVYGFGSALSWIGNITGSSALSGAGGWALGFTGIVIISVVAMIVPIFMVVFGMRRYAWIQRSIFVIVIGTIGIMAVILAVTSQQQWITSFNSMFSSVNPDMYDQVIKTASVSTTYSWSDTITWTSVLAPGFAFSWYMSPMLGEIKKADNLKVMSATYLCPIIFGMAIFGLTTYLLFAAVGQTFMASLGALINSGSPLLASAPLTFYWIYLPLVALQSPALIFLVGGIMITAMMLFFQAGNYIGCSRYLFSQSFDRILPKQFGYVDPKFHVPLVGILFMAIGSIAWVLWSNFQPSVWIFTAASLLASLGQNIIISLTGLLFAYRTPGLFETSPSAKYKIGGVPAIAVTGILGLIWNAILAYYYLAIPALGAQVPASYYVIAISFVGMFVLYFISQAYRKRQGIDLGLAFREIPPL
jgi:amino acid transporter